MPLPHVAVEFRLRVHLELVHVELLAEDLLHRLDQPRVPGEYGKRLVVGVTSERGARRAGLFPPDLLPILLEDLLGLVAQHRDLLLREALGEEEPALLVELLQLLGGELHGRSSC